MAAKRKKPAKQPKVKVATLIGTNRKLVDHVLRLLTEKQTLLKLLIARKG